MKTNYKMVDVIPTKDNVDYGVIYYYTNADAVKDITFYNKGRQINPSNVKNILKQIENKEEYGAAFIPSILVDINTLWVMDGMHRLTAFKQSWAKGGHEVLTVRYVNVPIEYIDTLMQKLQNARKWNSKDFFHRAIMSENKGAIQLKKWGECHPLCMGDDINLTYTQAFLYGTRKEGEIKNLTLEPISKEDLDYAETVYSDVSRLIEALNYKKGSWLEGFIQAWYEIRKENEISINWLTMDYICNSIYSKMNGFQTSTKKTDWKNKLTQILLNLTEEKMMKS